METEQLINKFGLDPTCVYEEFNSYNFGYDKKEIKVCIICTNIMWEMARRMLKGMIQDTEIMDDNNE